MFSRKAILRALACALLAMIPFPDLENRLYDAKTRILSRTYFTRPQEALVVELAKEDFDELRRRFRTDSPSPAPTGPWREKFESLRNEFFWDDDVYAALLERVLKENPRRLLVTFFYNESLLLLENRPALQRLARNGAVLWGSQFDLDQKLLRPAPELTGTENYGFSNVHPDPDGVVRRAYLLFRNHISLPFRALVEGPGSFRTNMPLYDPFLIRFTGPPGFVPTCRVRDLFDERRSAERCGSLEGRYVILSSTGNFVAGSNVYRTPVGYLSRGELLARTLLTARNEDPVRSVSLYFVFLAVFAHAGFVGRTVLRRRGRTQAWLASVLLGAEALVSLVVLRFAALQVPLVPFLAATVFAYFAFLWLKFSRAEEKRWQAEKKTQYLRELDELKSNFLSLMSHDLKTPIAKVQALTERLQREARSLNDEQRGLLGSIAKSNEELAHYILTILDFQRIETQEIQLQRRSRDVNVLIEEVAARLAPLAHDRRVDLKLDLEPMFPAELDENLIRQVLNNLVDNAIKYNGPGTVVTVKSADLGTEIEVSVADDGVGIAPEQAERLFKKFSRSEKGTSERVKGTGLGLYLAKYFIELHGGSIGVESAPGRGTCFRFRLPVA